MEASLVPAGPSSCAPITCFCCGQKGLQATMCPETTPKKGRSHERQSKSLRCPSLENEGEGTLTEEKPPMALYESDSEGEDNPMVNGLVNHLEANVDIAALRSGVGGGGKSWHSLGLHPLLD